MCTVPYGINTPAAFAFVFSIVAKAAEAAASNWASLSEVWSSCRGFRHLLASPVTQAMAWTGAMELCTHGELAVLPTSSVVLLGRGIIDDLSS